MGDPADVILFAFWGRRPNIELQIPFIHRILNQNQQVRFEGWNMARAESDDQYLRRLGRDFADAERFTIRHDFHGSCPWTGFNDIYRHYAADDYRGQRFVKFDDDVLFIETGRFGDFLEHISDDAVLTATVVNNGGCTRRITGLWPRFEALGINLLDVHESNAYAAVCHGHMAAQSPLLLGSPKPVDDCDDWLSINLIGYTWETGRRITDLLGQPSPELIAGRDCRQWPDLGDEGAVNLLPRRIHPMLAAHLGFGPQNVTDAQAHAWRNTYAQIGADYLAGVPA